MWAANDHAPFTHLGIAVSGGGDSMALLHLLHGWAGARAVRLSAASVDHGLRPEAANEARMVAETCAELGISHDILKWSGWDGQGNLQAQARRARYRLLAAWAAGRGVEAVALGHTRDDQAETFLMRLARGSGVDGLAAMRFDWTADNMRWLRPLRGVSRAALRQYLTGKAATWLEDPSNDDLRFDRIKARRALDVLAPMGVDADRLADTARSMALARKALQHYAHVAASELCQTQYGDVLIGKNAAKLPAETRYRLFAHALMWVASARYRPRFEALVEAVAQGFGGETRSLHGCLIVPETGSIRICREVQAVKGEVCAPGGLWDGRWRLTGANADEADEVRALGDALRQCPDWRATGLPRASLMASPALWRRGALVAAPLAGLANGWSAEIAPESTNFFTSILSH